MRNKRKRGLAQGNGKLGMPVIDADRARLIANEFCLFHYPTLYTGGAPRRGAQGTWSIPVVLEDPDSGISAAVGEVSVDAHNGKVLTFTPEAQVVSKGSDLYRAKHGKAASASAPRKK